jgi:hypothetical protein
MAWKFPFFSLSDLEKYAGLSQRKEHRGGLDCEDLLHSLLTFHDIENFQSTAYRPFAIYMATD